MVTEDWIDVLLLYDEYLEFQALTSLFEYLLDSPGIVSDKLDIAAWNDIADINHNLDTSQTRRAKQLVADTDGAGVKLIDEADDTLLQKPSDCDAIETDERKYQGRVS